MNLLIAGLGLLPLGTALLILLLPGRLAHLSRAVALFGSALVGVLGTYLWAVYDPTQAALFHVKAPWLPQLGVHFELALDGLNLPLVLLTVVLTPLVIFGFWEHFPDQVRAQRHWAVLLMLMEAGALGTFLSQDLLLFYISWELILVPAYLLIGMYGGAERRSATLQFFFYTFAGSLLMLVGIASVLYLQSTTGAPLSASFSELAKLKIPFADDTGFVSLFSFQGLVFLAFGAAFFVKAPLLPFHAWLPATYRQAPAIVTVYLAAVLSKMGTYGVIKVLMLLCPQALQAYAPVLMGLAALGIVYGALLAIVQTDLKSLIAYSSLSHVSYVLFGLFSLSEAGMGGALLQMLNHGIIIAGLFFVAAILERRRASLLLEDFGGWAAKTPLLAIGFFVLALAAVALPGTNGFVGEFMILVAGFKVNSSLTIVASLGVVLGAIYTLRLYQKTMFGPFQGKDEPNDLEFAETNFLLALVVAVFIIGLLPQPFLARSQSAVSEVKNRLVSQEVVAAHSSSESGKAR